MPNKPENFEIFDHVDSATMKLLMSKLKQYMHNAIPATGIELSDLTLNRSTMYDIFDRIEKRRVYFHIYHNGTKMSEIKEGALLCFWILKLMPFRAVNIPNSLLNTKIAYVIFVNMLLYVANKPEKKRKFNYNSNLMDETLYTFRYRDLSKEAIMLIAESYLHN